MKWILTPPHLTIHPPTHPPPHPSLLVPARCSKAIEHAGLPNLSREERCRHLNFVVVGGGPTGVELAAEMLDLVSQDVATLLPHLKVGVSGDFRINS